MLKSSSFIIIVTCLSLQIVNCLPSSIMFLFKFEKFLNFSNTCFLE